MSAPMEATTERDTSRDATIDDARRLLDAELPDSRFVDDSYLEWLYHANPLGDAIYGFRRSPDGQVVEGHYALIPQEYVGPAGPMRWMFSLNAVSRSGAQRRGHFVSLTQELFARAARADYVGAIGVTNDNSTRAVKRTDFRYLGPMPVLVRPRAPKAPSGWLSAPVDRALLDSPEWAALTEGIDTAPVRSIKNRYTPSYLRWRLGAPNSSPYTLHTHDDALAVSTVHHVGPIGVAVLLKVLPRGSAWLGRGFGNSVMNLVAHHHNSPAALYAGFNESVSLTGWEPPRRLLPAPLNLNYVSFNGALDVQGFDVETYEFLDCDAY